MSFRRPPPEDPLARRALYPVPEARELLGGISHAAFYDQVKLGSIKTTKIGARTFVSAAEIRRIAGAV